MDKSKQIQLTQGKFAIVDEEDFEFINQWKWCAVRKANKYYATRKYMLSYDRATKKVKNKTVYMHRLIRSAGIGEEIDHINGDSLDNRKENLRFCTHMENLQNRPVRSIAKSGYKGVTWDKKVKKWFVRCTANNVNIHGGYFLDKDEAARVYNALAIKHHGEFARLNNV